MLKSVKMHFSGNTEICLFFKPPPPYFFTGFRIHFGFQTVTLEIVKNHLSQKKSKIFFFGRKMRFLTNIAILRFFRNSNSKHGNSSFLSF